MTVSSIEFLGLPGSGKSHSENALFVRLRGRGINVYRFRVLADYFRVERHNSPAYLRSWQTLRKLGFSAPFFKKPSKFLPELGAELSEFQSILTGIIKRAVPSQVGQENVARWLRSELMAYHAWKESEVSNGSQNLLIADEAFLHRLAGLCASERLEESDIENFLTLRPHFDKAVFLKIETEESIRRKNQPPFQDPSLSHLMVPMRVGTACALNRIWHCLEPSEKIELEVESKADDVAHQIEMKLFNNLAP